VFVSGATGSVVGADGGISLSLLRDFQITFNYNKHSIRLEHISPLPGGSNPDFQDVVDRKR